MTIIPISGDTDDDSEVMLTMIIREIRRRIEANMREMVNQGHI